MIYKQVNDWFNIIQDWGWPPTCILCGFPGWQGRDLCRICLDQLTVNTCCCARCGQNFETSMPEDALCGRCTARVPAFDATIAPYLYQGPMRHLITSLKFNARLENARLLGQLLADRVKHQADRPDALLPMPLHPKRYRQRGFNQAIEIARTVAKEIELPLLLDACQRRRDTPHQTGLTAKQRRKNLQRAFRLVRPIEARFVVILDDVMTTGASAHELAALLKKAGVDRIEVWVCARA